MKNFMTKEKFDGFKANFKKKWDKIGTSDLDSMLDIHADEEKIVSKLAHAYHKTTDEMSKEFHEWIDKIEDEKEDRVKDIEEEVHEIQDVSKIRDDRHHKE